MADETPAQPLTVFAPESMMPCTYCGEPTEGHYREVRGWEQRRSQGGANKIVLREETGRYACNACVSSLRSGVNLGQRSLLD